MGKRGAVCGEDEAACIERVVDIEASHAHQGKQVEFVDERRALARKHTAEDELEVSVAIVKVCDGHLSFERGLFKFQK